MEIQDAIKVLKKDVEEEKNWRSARLKMIEVLETVDRGAADLAQLEARKRALHEDCARLGAEQTSLQHSVKRLQQEVSGWKADLAAKEKLKAERCCSIDEEIAAKERRLAELNTELRALKDRVSV